MGPTVTSVNTRTGAVTLTKDDVGLTNVDNTGDAQKPLSTAAQAALNAKLPTASVSTYALTLIDDVDAAAARATLGLGTAATAATSAFESAGAVTTHVAAADPHPQYLSVTEGGAAFAAMGHNHIIGDVAGLQTTLDVKAPLASPTLPAPSAASPRRWPAWPMPTTPPTA